MLMHFSLLFHPREASKEMVEKHANLCSKVLDIFLQIGRQLGTKLSVETWEIFLKLLTSCADYILRQDLEKIQEALPRKLNAQIMKVVFELFLLSKTRNPDLWGALIDRVSYWTHHMSLILTWKTFAISLTRRTAAILYGPSEGSETVSVKLDDSTQNLQLEDEYVFYAWHKLLYILGNPNEQIKHPAIFLAFMNGIEMLVNFYLALGSKEINDVVAPPSGNTILNLVGPWLFDAIQLDRKGFDEGTALALKILCNIVMTKAHTNIQPYYIAHFYFSLQQSLLKEGRVLLAGITSCTNLFSYSLQGVRCLLPAFVFAIHKILSRSAKPFDNVMPAEHVRRSCLTILGQILPLPNHFQDSPFKLNIMNLEGSQGAQIKPFDVGTFTQLKNHYNIILMDSLSNENYAPNLERILSLTYLWQCENIDNSSDFTKQSLTLIVRKMTTAWPHDVTKMALKIVSQMSELYPKIEKGSDQADRIIKSLCKYVTTQIKAINHNNQEKKEELTSLAYQCICNWLMVEQWLLKKPKTRDELLKAIVLGLTGNLQNVIDAEQVVTKEKTKKKKKDEKKNEKQNVQQILVISDKIKNAAHETLLVLLNQTGNFPTACGPSAVSTLITELEVLDNNIELSKQNGEITINPKNSKEYIRYFITLEKVIICCIDRPFNPSGPSVTLIVRDKTGKYAWDINLSYLPITVPKFDPPKIAPPPISDVPFQPLTQPVPLDEIDSIFSYLENQPTKNSFPIVQNQVQKEDQFLVQNNFHLNTDITVKEPEGANPYSGACGWQQSRMLLSHLGYLSLENRDQLYPLHMNHAFFNALRNLDQVSERECVKISCIFARKGQSTLEEYLGNEGGSIDFQEFINSLGWGVKLSKHNGFKGGLESKRAGPITPYWANFSTEVTFQISTLIPNTDSHPEQNHKKRIILGNNVYVVIVWVEDLLTFSPQMIWHKAKSNCVIICINPLPHGLYSIRIFSKSESTSVGPLFDGVVVSKYSLGLLVRSTSIAIHTKERVIQEGEIGMLEIRENVLDDIFRKYKIECNLEKFYSSLFSTNDIIGPHEAQLSSSSNIEVSRKTKRKPKRTLESPVPPQRSKGDLRSHNKRENSSNWSSTYTRPSHSDSQTKIGVLGSHHRRNANNENQEEEKSRKKKSSKKLKNKKKNNNNNN
eukprot:TRINITY_DN9967_c1_g1_i3.p1 TRINITY_DN9967_c1_g1~~TRINITY_DN9967_c1_g1_i3.p1  ORF type:complete len:1160 (+),score=392.41 TRINITY_DN9967_c1_g1_i3:355-3834(+)